MATNEEKLVGIAERMFLARRLLKSANGEAYGRRVEKFGALVAGAMKKKNTKNEIEGGMDLVKAATDKGEEVHALWFLAAIVEMIEGNLVVSGGENLGVKYLEVVYREPKRPGGGH